MAGGNCVIPAGRALRHSVPVSLITAWAATVIDDGLGTVNRLLTDTEGPFAFGNVPGLADLSLVSRARQRPSV